MLVATYKKFSKPVLQGMGITYRFHIKNDHIAGTRNQAVPFRNGLNDAYRFGSKKAGDKFRIPRSLLGHRHRLGCTGIDDVALKKALDKKCFGYRRDDRDSENYQKNTLLEADAGKSPGRFLS